MRKMLGVILVLFSAAPAFAAEKDIVDTAVAAKFKTLVAAVKAADLVDTLKGEWSLHRLRPDRRGVRQAPQGDRRGAAQTGEQGQTEGDPDLPRRLGQSHGD